MDFADTLTRKYGPLPGYAWVGIGALVIVLVGSTVRGRGAASAAPLVNPDGTTESSEFGGGELPAEELGAGAPPIDEGFELAGNDPWWSSPPDDWNPADADAGAFSYDDRDPQTIPAAGLLDAQGRLSVPDSYWISKGIDPNSIIRAGGPLPSSSGAVTSSVYGQPARMSDVDQTGYGPLAMPPAPAGWISSSWGSYHPSGPDNPVVQIQTPQTPNAIPNQPSAPKSAGAIGRYAE